MMDAILKIRHSVKLRVKLVFFASLYLALACDKLGLQNLSDSSSDFAGVQTINLMADGQYVLFWNHSSKPIDSNAVSYDIYMDKWTAESADLESDAAPVTNRDEGTTLAARFAKMPEADSPIGKGTKLASIKAARSYALDIEIKPDTIYAFAIRSVDGNGNTDDNQRVLIYNPVSSTLKFAGITKVALNSSGKLKLSWDKASFSDGREAEDITYSVFMSVSSESSDKILSEALNVIPALATLPVAAGQLIELPAKKLPSARQKPMGEVNDATSFTLSEDLTTDVTYIFQVRSRSESGDLDNNNRVIVYQRIKFQFEGLLQENVSLSSDNSRINLSWSPAINAVGNVTYVIFQDSSFNSALAQTSNLSYSLTSPTPGATYTLGVRARDSDGMEYNTKTVLISVPDLRDKIPPVFAGLSSAVAISNKKILLTWAASTSSDVDAYYVYHSYNLKTPIASTKQTTFEISGLTAATSYTFVVRAKDASGNEDENFVQHSGVTFSYAVPDFSGVSSMTPAAGVNGLNKLVLSWPMAGGSVTGYRVYMATSSKGQNFALPLAVEGANVSTPAIGAYVDDVATTSATVSGLAQGTSYYFVVRAFYRTGTTVYAEQNTVERSGSTLTVTPPSSFRIASAAPAAGNLGLTAVNVSWGSPSSDGIYDAFNIVYEAGSCAAGFSASPSSLLVADAVARTATVYSLTPQTTYRFRVRTYYTSSAISDSNSVCLEANTTPTAPVFIGVSSVSTAAGVLGFSTLNVFWPQAQGSFSNYLLEWSASPGFTTILGSQTISSISTTSSSISGLTTASPFYVRVKARFTESGFSLESGGQLSLTASTSPMAPSGEGLSAIAIASGSQLNLAWTPPTNAGSVYSGFKLWRSCGSSAASGIISALSGAPYRIFASASTLAFQDIGLTSNVQCCYQVRGYYSDGTYSLGSSSLTPAHCQTPVVIAPNFAGISGLAAPVSSVGFNQLSASWSAISSNDVGNFSCYQISVSTSSASPTWPASCDAVDASLRSAKASSYALTGLNANTNYFVRVRVVNANGSAPVSNGDNIALSATTTPPSPTGDVLHSAASSGVSAVTLSYTPPSPMPEVGGLYNNVFLLVYQGSADSLAAYKQSVLSPDQISSPSFAGVMSSGTITLSAVPTSGALIRVPLSALNAGANSFRVDGLTTGAQICVTALAVYWTSGITSSQFLQSSQNSSKCATPTAIAPSFAGVSAVTTPVSVQGFTQLNLSWTAIANADLENFSYYKIQWATSATPSSWNSATIATAASNSASITGLTPNTTYYVSVAAVNALGSAGSIASGDSVIAQAVTTPKAPTSDNLSAAVSAGSTSIQLSYTAPSATAGTGGLYNTIFLWVYQTSQTSVVNGFQSSLGVPIGGPLAGSNITGTLSGGAVTLASAPTAGALIQVPLGSFMAGGNNTFTINGLSANQSVCVRAAAVYWINGDAARYLLSETPSTRCAIPTSVAPSFAGVTSLTEFGDTRDFAGMQVNWGNITGECSSVDISVSGASGLANFGGALGVSGLSCALRTYNLTGLTAGQTYYVQVRANNSTCGASPSCSNGSGIELYKVTVPAPPTGDSTSGLTFTTLAKASDSAILTYVVPTSGTWNQISIFRASGISQEAATTAVRAAAMTLPDYSGPTSAPLAEVTNLALTTYTDSSALEGVIYCYLAKAVYKATGRYSASASISVQCGSSSFAGIAFAGLDASTGAVLSANCPTAYNNGYQDETAMVQLNFPSAPGTGVEEYWVYYSNTSELASFDLIAAPYQIVDNSATSIFNPTLSSASIYVGCQGRTFSGPAYFLVRAIHYGAATPDSNAAISNGIDIPASRSNFVYVSPTVSRLSYPYWIGIGESHIASATTTGLTSSTSIEVSLAACNYQFHVNKSPAHSSCGTSGTVNKAEMRHGSGSGPHTWTSTWHSAMLMCRNASEVGNVGSTGASSQAGNFYSRLPTEEEWRRASRPAANNYGNLASLYSGGCQISGGVKVNARDKPSCNSAVGARNMVGSSSEWVDQRLIGYDISAASESRFSYGPAIGRVLANGIDIQASGVIVPVTPRYHNIAPGSYELGLLMGSDSNGAYSNNINATSGSNVVTLASVGGSFGGQILSTGIFPYGTRITAINSATSLTLSSTAAITGTATLKGHEKQNDAETARWQDTRIANATNAFRCVAWPSGKLMPTMAQLAQTSEPVYNATEDLPGGASPTAAQLTDWKIPENLYVKDTKPETVRHLLKHFPNTTGLAVWPMNGTSSGDQADISGNGKTLTVPGAAPLMSGSGLDGKTYFNWINGTSGNMLNATVDLFNLTSSFTMGGWFYRSNWGAAINQGGILGQLNANGYRLLLHNGALCFTTTSSACAYGSADVTTIRPGWHHIVAVKGSASDQRIYVDGTLSWSNTSTWNIVSDGSFSVGHFYLGQAGAANIFFHAGIGYTTAQVKRLYQASSSFDNAYANADNHSGNDGVKITWKPWSKKVCTTSCADSDDTGITYYMYRAIEPTKVDLRHSIPWAIKTLSGAYSTLPSGLTGANATAMPLDPLATDPAGNLLCSNSFATTPNCLQVATITGSTCNSSAITGCSFIDSAALDNGFTSTAIYNYIMVVRDAEGNYRTPKVQRYRSPYFAGDPSHYATATFRTEQRWRRASLMLVDELYQSAQSIPQVMAYVPMDVSGLDHDFFIQKYEASKPTAPAAAAAAPVADPVGWPLRTNADGTWRNLAALCQHTINLTGTFDNSCGDGTSTYNATTTVAQSKAGVAPLVSTDQGAYWKTCANATIQDSSGNSYRLALLSDSEWLKAADWGDVNQDGTIDQSVNSGTVINTLESGSTDGTTVRCHTDGLPNAAFTTGNPATANCRSRYGAADTVGNVQEWTNGQKFDTVGYDNGVDGLWLGQTLLTMTGASFGTQYDLLRAIPKSSNAPTISNNGDFQWYAAGLRGSWRGGNWAYYSRGGRWPFNVDYAPSFADATVGGRCGR